MTTAVSKESLSCDVLHPDSSGCSAPARKGKDRREQYKAYHAKHRDERNAQSKEYREEHRDERLEYKRKYRESHRDEILEYARKYREKNRDRIKKFRDENREKVNAGQRRFRLLNPDKARSSSKRWHTENQHKFREYARAHRDRKINAPGSGISAYQEREIFEQYNYRCAYCGKICKNIEIDHIVALANGGADDIENATVSCRSCNARKGNRSLLRFMYNVRKDAQNDR
jgi:5-methylcytosine-specific restriction endonuclease McrA